MPPRPLPKIYQLLIKTHKLTIFLTVPPTTTLASVKEEVLSALASDVNQAEDIPQISDIDDFEICRATKGNRKLTTEYDLLLDTDKQMKDLGFVGWEVLYIQFRDGDDFAPVIVTQPSLDDEDEPAPAPLTEDDDDDVFTSKKSKGKRKARSDDEFED